jgi:hypothetical protein
VQLPPPSKVLPPLLRPSLVSGLKLNWRPPHHPPPLPPSPPRRDAPHKRNLLGRGEGAMAVPLWLHPGTSELDNVPYIKTPGPGHILVARIPYPPTRTTVLLLFVLGRRVAAVAREFPAKLTLLSGSRMPALTVPTNKNEAEVSRYCIPYSPARTYRTVLQMSAPSSKPPMPRRKLAYKRPANHEVSTLLGI